VTFAGWSRLLGGAAIAMFVLVGFTPLANVVSYWLTPHRQAERADVIVVMGRGGVRSDGTLSPTSRGAVVDALRLYRAGAAPMVVFSGPATLGTVTEAAARATFAQECGLPASAIATAGQGRTTHEEAEQIGALLHSRGVRRIVLVADEQGMGRAMGAFERLGFSVWPDPAASVLDLGGTPEARLGLMRLVAIEILARIYYRAAGYL
jgi:uncharacterized SAM-binding protein YcdF (DUF218 family)